MLTFEGDPVAANYLLDEWPEGLLAHTCKFHHSGFRSERNSRTTSVGRSVSDVARKLGPPTTKFDLGNGQSAFD